LQSLHKGKISEKRSPMLVLTAKIPRRATRNSEKINGVVSFLTDLERLHGPFNKTHINKIIETHRFINLSILSQ